MENLPPDVIALAQDAVDNSMPLKSETIYRKVYADFCKWMMDKGILHISEMVVLAYLNKLSETLNSQTLWSRYSMIARMVFNERSVDIKSYGRVKTFLKNKSLATVPKKAKVFTSQQIGSFLNNADDSTWLSTKVCTIIYKCIE